MPTQLRIKIWLENPKYKVWPFALRGELFRWLKEVNPSLHGLQPKPFSLGQVVQEGGYLDWELNLLDDGLLKIFEQLLVLGKSVGADNEVQGRITGIEQLEQKSFATFLPETASDQIVVKFHTPTALSSGGMDWDRPIPVLIWHGLSERWNLLRQQMLEAGRDRSELPQQTPAPLKDWITSHLICHNYRIQPATMKLGNTGQLKGFTGQARYGFRLEVDNPTDTLHARWVMALARFAQFAGVGIKTVYGCGVVELLGATPTQLGRGE